MPRRIIQVISLLLFFSRRSRHTISDRDWSSDVCSSDLTKLARQDPRVAERIIFATGDTVRGDTLQFLEALGRPYLHKPFTLAELRAALGHAAKQPA